VKVEVPSKLEEWVSAQLEAGAFHSADELLTEALELLKMRLALEEQSAFLSQDAKRRAALRELVEQGQRLRMGY
jgi:Arc/MetJ-type ribon-helix-helix transcriptional regulator